MEKKTILVIIDPQNDFCDIPEQELPRDAQGNISVRPALAVPGATQDMKRLAALVRNAGRKLRDIQVTLDSHNPVDIAHQTWFVDVNGNHPAPFTVISSKDMEVGTWRTTNPAAQAYTLEYVRALEANNRYLLIIWPEHCLIGSWGHNIYSELKQELDIWARKRLATVGYVTKGSNPKTEHYSAVQAEVPDPSDASTQMNSGWLSVLSEADEVLIAGEALSHCVANTVRDIANNFGSENIKKLVLLEDCTSSVGGFEAQGQAFVDEMVARGMRVAKSTDYF